MNALIKFTRDAIGLNGQEHAGADAKAGSADTAGCAEVAGFIAPMPGGTGITLAGTACTGTLLNSIVNNGGGLWTQALRSAASPGSGTVTGTITGTGGQIVDNATVTYVAAGGVTSSIVCTQSQSSGQNRTSNVTVNLCSNVVNGDMKIVTLGLDLTDDVVTPGGGGEQG